MAIKKLTAETISFSGNSYYQNVGRLFDAICALFSDVEVIERVSDSSKGFSGYFRFNWAPEYVFRISNNEAVSGSQYRSAIHIQDFIKSDTGTYTIGGELYANVSDEVENSVASAGKLNNIAVFEDPGKFAICTIDNSKARFVFGLVKMREICSGEEFFLTVNDVEAITPRMYYDGAVSTLNNVPMLSITADNGFVRMIPIVYYGCKKIATATDATAICTGYAKGASMTFSSFTDFSVGEHRFFAIGSARAIKYT